MSCLQRLYKHLKVDILNFFNPESAIKNKLKYFLLELRGFKFVTHCFYRLKIGSKNVTKYSNFYWNLKAETIINESDIDDLFEPMYSTITWYKLTYRKILGKVWTGILVQSSITPLMF